MDVLKVVIIRSLKGRSLVIFAGLTVAIYAYMWLLPIPKMNEFLGEEKILDIQSWGYDSVMVTDLFKALGKEGRDIYLYQQLPADLLFPWVYVPALCLLIALLLQKVNLLESRWFSLCFLPIACGVFDLLENTGIIYLLTHHDSFTATSVSLASWATRLKTLFLGASGGSILGLLLLYLYRRIF